MIRWSLPPQARGVWVKIPAIEVVEVLARSGIDFIVIDCEHSQIHSQMMSTMIAVARGLGLPAFVRVSSPDAREVQGALDAGATGIFFPHVDDASIAQEAVGACRFPPVGHRRGSPTTRAGYWGEATVEGMRESSDGVIVVAQIESPEAIDQLERILTIEGIDGVFLGPFDLAISSDLKPQDDEFRQLLDRFEHAAGGRVPMGGAAHGPPATAELDRRGYDFVMIGADTTLLSDATQVGLGGS